MSSAKISECLLCGKEYEVCKFCQQVKEYTPWKIDFDSPRHFQIYNIVKEIREKILTADEAKAQLNHLGVTAKEIDEFVPSVQATLRPVMGNEAPAEKPAQKSAAKPEDEKPEPFAQASQPSMNPFRGRNRK